MQRASQVRAYPSPRAKTLTYEKRLHLGLFCKLLRRKRLPAIFYQGLQHSGIYDKKSRSVFHGLLVAHLPSSKTGRQRMIPYLMSLPRHIVCRTFHRDLEALNCLNESFLLDGTMATLKLSQFGNFVG